MLLTQFLQWVTVTSTLVNISRVKKEKKGSHWLRTCTWSLFFHSADKGCLLLARQNFVTPSRKNKGKRRDRERDRETALHRLRCNVHFGVEARQDPLSGKAYTGRSVPPSLAPTSLGGRLSRVFSSFLPVPKRAPGRGAQRRCRYNSRHKPRRGLFSEICQHAYQSTKRFALCILSPVLWDRSFVLVETARVSLEFFQVILAFVHRYYFTRNYLYFYFLGENNFINNFKIVC